MYMAEILLGPSQILLSNEIFLNLAEAKPKPNSEKFHWRRVFEKVRGGFQPYTSSRMIGFIGFTVNSTTSIHTFSV